MSYCTARRMAAEARVRQLQETLKQIEANPEPDNRRLRHVKEALQHAQNQLATIGDCGD